MNSNQWLPMQVGVGMLLVFWLVAAFAQAVPSTKAAFRLAIQDGYAETWADANLQSEINQKLQRPLDHRVRIKLRRLQQFNPDCARLAMVFADPAGKNLFEVQMNLCTDGSPPMEGVNLAAPVPPDNATAVPRLARP